MELKELRAQIDAIDDELLALLVRRLEIAREVGALKAARGLPVRDAAREAELLNRMEMAAPPESRAAVRALFGNLLALSRAQQEAR